MLKLALRTLRTRWVLFVGSFVALALGVALIAVMGLTLASSLDAPGRAPQRFGAAAVVVKGADTLSVPTRNGVKTQKLAQPRVVPAATVARLKRLGAVVEDRSFPVRARGGPGDLVGHPWSVAAFAPYTIDAGRAPRAGDEVVAGGSWARPGQSLRTDHGTVRVVGTVGDRGFEHALFYTDARAAQLEPTSEQLVMADANPSAVRDVVRGSGAQVLTGQDRHQADADPDRDGRALTAMNALFGTAGAVASFVSVFVVASTFAFAVAQRGREFGLLRMAGATPGQIRRMVLAEASTVGVLASASGCVLGAYGAPRLAAWAVDGALAPAWFTIGDSMWPYHMAFWTGVVVALCGAAAASWRAGRTAPTEALREASVDARPMTWGRGLCGVALALVAAVTLGMALATDPGGLLHRKSYVSRPMLLITAVALLAPVVVRPLVRVIAWLPTRLSGIGGTLIRASALAGVRRTAAIAAPVLVMVALAGSLLGATATLDRAKIAERREQTAADVVVIAPKGAGFDAVTLRKLRALTGAEVSPTSTTAVCVLEDEVALVKSDARAAEPGALTATTHLPITAGNASDLDDGSIIVTEEWQRHTVGQRVRVWLGDGTEKWLRIAAVMATGTGNNGAYVTPHNAPGARVDRLDITAAPGTETGSLLTTLHAALDATGARVLTKAQWTQGSDPAANRTTRLGLFLVLGIALLYTGISVANTMVMAAPGRVRDMAVLRLAGATRWQVLRLVGGEALLVVAVGAILGLLVTVLNLAGLWGALDRLSVRDAVAIPWASLVAAPAACAGLAVVASVIPAALALRRATGEFVGVAV
ncbi:ABC transporter permease [Streptomyces sp. NPDC048361]|uniref:ABC transporter permease n=1 Tax=Streptomyces sp. NPDC048361 TaxID=3154720 RepID=UPI0034409892